MKEKVCIFNADSDVTAIDCNISDAAVTFKKTDDNALSVILPSAKNVHAGNDKGTLYISQTKRTALFARRQKIIVCVPEHIVPSLTFNGKRCTLEIEGNIYADINIIAESGDISLTDTSANDLEINGDRLSISINDSTFKGNLYVNARAAEEHMFNGAGRRNVNAAFDAFGVCVEAQPNVKGFNIVKIFNFQFGRGPL